MPKSAETTGRIWATPLTSSVRIWDNRTPTLARGEADSDLLLEGEKNCEGEDQRVGRRNVVVVPVPAVGR